MIIVIMKTLEPFEKIKKSSYIVAVFRSHVIDFSFIVTGTHQKIKPIFCRINFDYTKNFAKQCFVFFHLFPFKCKKRKEKYTLNSIVLKNLFQRLFSYSNIFSELYELEFIFKFYIYT